MRRPRISAQARRASVWRPLLYNATTRCSQSRSRQGCSWTNALSSGTSRWWHPSASSAAIRSSMAPSRESVRRNASSSNDAEPRASANASPRHRPRASRRHVAAPSVSRAAARARPCSRRRANRSASSASDATRSRYPGVMDSSSEAQPTRASNRRISPMRTCNTRRPRAGPRPGHSSSISRSTATTRSWLIASRANRERSFGARGVTSTPSTSTRISPSTPIWRSTHKNVVGSSFRAGFGMAETRRPGRRDRAVIVP